MDTKFEYNPVEDIAVFGRIVNRTDGVVASAAQIWDDDFSTNGMMQNEINKKFADDISAMSSDIVEISDKDIPVATTERYGTVRLATGRDDSNTNSVVTIGILKGITEGADESFDTLKEISDYLKNNSDISELLNLLNQKANASDLTALINRITAVEGSIADHESRISALETCCEEMHQSQGGDTDSFMIVTTFGTGTTATNTEHVRTITAGSTYTNTFSLLDGYKNLTVTITDGNDNVLFSGSSESGNVVATVENVTTALVISVSATKIEGQGGGTEQNNVLSFDAAGTITSRTENVSSDLAQIPYELYWNGTKLTDVQALGASIEPDNWISAATSEQLGTHVNVGANETDSARSGRINFTYWENNSEALTITMYINQEAKSSNPSSDEDNYWKITTSSDGGLQGGGISYVAKGEPLSRELQAKSDYQITSVTVTMEGSGDITDTAYSSATNTISIPSVTGNVTVTVVTEYVATLSNEFTDNGTKTPLDAFLLSGNSASESYTSAEDNYGEYYNVPIQSNISESVADRLSVQLYEQGNSEAVLSYTVSENGAENGDYKSDPLYKEGDLYIRVHVPVYQEALDYYNSLPTHSLGSNGDVILQSEISDTNTYKPKQYVLVVTDPETGHSANYELNQSAAEHGVANYYAEYDAGIAQPYANANMDDTSATAPANGVEIWGPANTSVAKKDGTFGLVKLNGKSITENSYENGDNNDYIYVIFRSTNGGPDTFFKNTDPTSADAITEFNEGVANGTIVPLKRSNSIGNASFRYTTDSDWTES